jgi:uncharacterized membrane protein YccC
MPPIRRDLAAPHWLVQLLRSTPAPVPWRKAVRAAIALTVPLTVGMAFGSTAIGALVSIGVLPTVVTDSPGTYRYRARRLGGVAVAAVTGFGIGVLASGELALSIPAVVLVAAVSALISGAGSNASVAGLQLFVFTVVGTGQQVTNVHPGLVFGCFAIGACWGLLVALADWTVRATSPERNAVAQVYIELAAMLSTDDEMTRRVARHQLTQAMNTAYDRLLSARSWLSGRDDAYRKLLNLLSATTPAVEAAVAIVHSGRRPPAEVVTHLSAVATSVLANAPLPAAPVTDSRDPAVRALYDGLSKIGTDVRRERRPRVPVRTLLRDWLESVSGPLAWVAALRLTLCVALAELAALLLPLERSYWITLTVGIVLKPDFGSVFGRAVLRGLGTMVGVVAGSVVLATGTRGWLLVVLVAVFAAGVPIGKTRNFGIQAAFITPLIIVQMDLTTRGDWEVVFARLLDTVIGCAIVLVFGYLLWPGSLRPRVGGRLAEVTETVARYVEHGLRPAETPEERTERSRRRRRAYRGLADLRTAFQQTVVEPSAAGRQATAWWPAIVGLERVTDATTEVVVTMERGAPAPGPDEVRQLVDALNELAAAIRAERRPELPPMPGGDQLSGVVDQIQAAFDAVAGPDLDRLRLPFWRRHTSGG